MFWSAKLIPIALEMFRIRPNTKDLKIFRKLGITRKNQPNTKEN